MKPFTLLIKPASADCNLACEYCFYLEKRSLYPGASPHRMPETVLARMIESYMATDQPCYSFGWQGGEPTLMGLDFFQKVTDLQMKHGRAGASVANGLQTNATLIAGELARHLAKHKFLVGCSLDGPKEVHDTYRRPARGGGSHQDVMRGIDTLRRHGVEFNILVLVSRANVKSARLVYRYLTDHGFFFHQYIPCVEFDEAGRPEPFAINGDEWGDFMCGLFDEWHRHDAFKVSIRQFDSILAMMLDNVANVCSMGDNCCQYFLVEHNGDIYPCDFFVEPRLRIGNVTDTSWDQALASPVYSSFGAMKSAMNPECATCPYLRFCAADCLKHRLYAGQPPTTLSWLCSGWKRFYAHTLGRFEELARKAAQQRSVQAAAVPAPAGRHGKTPGRNEPCPCGSGKKFKKCCG